MSEEWLPWEKDGEMYGDENTFGVTRSGVLTGSNDPEKPRTEFSAENYEAVETATRSFMRGVSEGTTSGSEPGHAPNSSDFGNFDTPEENHKEREGEK